MSQDVSEGSLRASVASAIRAFEAGDEHEARDRARSLSLIEMEDPFSRASFEPGHFTASAFVLSPDGERVLLIHHRKLGMWLQPGGHFEAGDADVIAAAKREVREETGLWPVEVERAGLFDVDVHSIPAHGSEPAHEHFDLRVLLRARGEALEINAEVKAARWVPRRSVDANASDFSVVRALAKL